MAALWHGVRKPLIGRGAGRKPTWDYKINAECNFDIRHGLIAEHRASCSASALARMLTGSKEPRGVEVEQGGMHAAFCASLRGEPINPMWLARPARPRTRELWIPTLQECALFAVVVRRLTALADAHLETAVMQITRGHITAEIIGRFEATWKSSSNEHDPHDTLLTNLSIARAVGTPSAAKAAMKQIIESVGARSGSTARRRKRTLSAVLRLLLIGCHPFPVFRSAFSPARNFASFFKCQ